MAHGKPTAPEALGQKVPQTPLHVGLDNRPGQAADDHPYLGMLRGVVGVLESDRDPRRGRLDKWGDTGDVALDGSRTSVGVDLGHDVQFNRIELAASRRADRIEKSDLSVYVSDDNNDYQRIDEWDFLRVETSIYIFNLCTRSRYVKVHCHLADQLQTFNNSLQHLMAIMNVPRRQWTFEGGGTWAWRMPITVHNPNNETIFDRAVHISKNSLNVADLIASGKLEPDLRDARFADILDREMQFYEDTSGFHVRIPQLGANATDTIYFYYGNPKAGYRGKTPEALQVEYGYKTIEDQSKAIPWSDLKPVRLQNGALLIAGGMSRTSGMQARYSFDDGHTWSAPETLLEPSNMNGSSTDSPCGFWVDPDTERVLLMIQSHYHYRIDGHSAMDPGVCRNELHTTWSSSFVAGRPVFAPPRRISDITTNDGRLINYALNYTNPIRLTDGTFLAPIHYIYRDNGAFAASTLLSEDGVTWSKSASELTIPGGGHEIGVTQSAIIQLQDATIVMYLRWQSGNRHYLGQSSSADGGRTWSELTESQILSTNTLPALSRHSNGDILLSWSGHNAMGSDAYFRDDITIAVSTDETSSWHKHRDLLRRPLLSSAANWENNSFYNAVEVDKTYAGNDSYLITWSARCTSMLVEDFHRFLYRSHGAVERFGHSESAKTVPLPSAVSRVFPGTRRASVRFSMRANHFDPGIYIALQEGFAQTWNAPGTAYALRITDDGLLQYTDFQQYETRPRIAWAENDVNHERTNLSNFGRRLLIAFDHKNRSIGADLGNSRTIESIRLHSKEANNRIDESDLSVYISDRNAGDWRQVRGWSFAKISGDITISDLNVKARYIKLVQSRADMAFTFYEYIHQIMEVVVADPQPTAPFVELAKPTRLSTGKWHHVVIDFDLAQGNAQVTVNGEVRGVVPQIHRTQTVKHILITTDDNGEADIELDELIVQDTEVQLPSISSIGTASRSW